MPQGKADTAEWPPALAAPPMLEVDAVSIRFRLGGGRWLQAVDGVSLDIAAGEAVGLVGESGCGKSTLARLINRLIDPDAGGIRLEGAEIGGIGVRAFARHPARARVQMVFQDATDALDPNLTAFRAIAAPLRRLRRLDARDAAARVREAAALSGLPAELLHRLPHQLSGGQKARVGLARALAPGPSLLVLDEPTSALDVSVQATVLRLLDDLRTRLSVAMLFISHDLNVVRLLCDRVMVMHRGRIVESGPSSQVFATPLHPYTQALIAAIPDPARRGHRPAVDDAEPAGAAASGCAFAVSCRHAAPICQAEVPVLRQLRPGHSVTCHLAERWLRRPDFKR
jgi:oligopeptide/dipeptide ABC transporter ATP-binding protein